MQEMTVPWKMDMYKNRGEVIEIVGSRLQEK